MLQKKQFFYQGWLVCIFMTSSAVSAIASYDTAKSSTEQGDSLFARSGSPTQPQKSKSFMLHGKAEVNEQTENRLLAAQAAQLYRKGVLALAAKKYADAAEYFRKAGIGYEAKSGNEKFLADATFAESQARRLLGQREEARRLCLQAIDLYRRYDPLSPYLKAAMDNLNNPPLHGNVALFKARLKALEAATSIQSVDKDVYLKGSASDTDKTFHSGKVIADVTKASIEKTVLQAFVKMTCIETADLGSNYYTVADRYVPLQANGKALAISATSGFLAPVIQVKLNGHFHNVGVDLPDLSASHKTVYLVTDGRNVLAIDPGTYDVWKLYAKFNKQNDSFEWHKLTHKKDIPARINIPNNDKTL